MLIENKMKFRIWVILAGVWLTTMAVPVDDGYIFSPKNSLEFPFTREDLKNWEVTGAAQFEDNFVRIPGFSSQDKGYLVNKIDLTEACWIRDVEIGTRGIPGAASSDSNIPPRNNFTNYKTSLKRTHYCYGSYQIMTFDQDLQKFVNLTKDVNPLVDMLNASRIGYSTQRDQRKDLGEEELVIRSIKTYFLPSVEITPMSLFKLAWEIDNLKGKLWGINRMFERECIHLSEF